MIYLLYRCMSKYRCLVLEYLLPWLLINVPISPATVANLTIKMYLKFSPFKQLLLKFSESCHGYFSCVYEY